MRKLPELFFTVFIILIQQYAHSQNANLAWAKSAGGSSNDFGYGVAVDASGNAYTTGVFSGTIDFDPGPGVFNLISNGSNDVFISKLDATGNFVWAKSVGGTNNDYGNSIMLDHLGNSYITGSFFATVDFDPGTSVFNLSTGGGDDAFVLKLDAAGNFIWAKNFGSNSNEIPYNIFVDFSGNAYTTGYFDGTSDFDPGPGIAYLTSSGGSDIFISKLDASGNFVWAKNMGGASGDMGYGVTVDISGNVYSTGVFVGAADFDPNAGVFNLTAAGSVDAYISKLDASGNFIWAKSIGSTALDFGKALTLDLSGNVYTTGSFNGTVDFDPGASVFNLTSAGSGDIFILKLDAAGNFAWAKNMGSSFGSDAGDAIALDSSGNVYSTGRLQGTGDFDPGPGVFNLTIIGNQDIFISKLDASGNFVWAKNMGGPSASNGGASIAVIASGNVYITGNFGGTTDFDPNAGVVNLVSAGLLDHFVLKLCQIPLVPSVISGATLSCSGLATTYSATSTWATSYLWNLPTNWIGTSTLSTITATTGITGLISATALNSCGASGTQTLMVTINPSPTITTNSGAICIGNSFSIVPSGANTYTIQGGSNIVSPTSSANYTVAGTGANGCMSSNVALSSVTVNALPIINVVSSVTLLCVNESATLTAGGASTYTWSSAGTGTAIIINPTVTTNYTLSGTDANGCMNSSILTQSVDACLSIDEHFYERECSVFPNPTTDKLNLRFDQNTTYKLSLINYLGQSIYIFNDLSSKQEIDLSQFTSGIYFLKVEYKKRQKCFKIIKE